MRPSPPDYGSHMESFLVHLVITKPSPKGRTEVIALVSTLGDNSQNLSLSVPPLLCGEHLPSSRLQTPSPPTRGVFKSGGM